MKYEYKFTLTDQDYLAFNKFHLFTLNKKVIWPFRLLVPIMLAAVWLIWFLAEGHASDLIVQGIVFAVVAVAWLFLVNPFFKLLMKSSIKSMKKKGKLPYSNKETTLVFDEDNFIETTPETENKTAYTMIEKVLQSDNALYIYINSAQAFIIPFYVFKQGELEELKEFLHDKRSAVTQSSVS